MAIIKCKICGGDVPVEPGQTNGICPFHGGPITFPKDTTEQRVNLFNRADSFRRQNEFDKAISAYEKILEEDPTDAEAHWGAVLSRFGIEYVENPLTFERKPTLHRLQTTSILADDDYKAAVDNAPDDETRALYEQQAQEIADIQKKVLDQSQREEQYDIFISYKEKGEDGQRTPDSVYAFDIYTALKKEGYNVFYARESLKGRLGDEYEPIIFSALRSSQVMILVGTRKEYFESQWVRNEWSRYLDIMKQERDKPLEEQVDRQLIPCYRDMDAYELPVELNMLQSMNMNSLGFLQDLIAGVRKIMDNSSSESYVGKTDEISTQLMRAMNLAELGQFSRAHNLAEKVLSKDPNNATALMIELLVQLQVNTPDELVKQPKELTHNRLYIMACRNAKGAQKKRYESYNKKIIANLEAAEKQKTLDAAVEAMHELEKKEKSLSGDDTKGFEALSDRYKEQAEELDKLGSFGDAEAQAQACRKKAEDILHDIQVRKEERQRRLEDEIAKKKAVEDQLRREREAREEKERQEKLEKERQEKERLDKIRRHKAHKRLAVFLVILTLAGAVTAYKLYFEDKLAYGAAIRTIESAENNDSGQLEYAETLLRGLGEQYDDVSMRLKQIEADRQFYKGQKRKAYQSYQQLEAAYRTPHTYHWYGQQYDEALRLISQNQFDDAIRILKEIEYYSEGERNAAEQIQRAYMLKGDAQFQLGTQTQSAQAEERFKAALKAYQSDNNYQDTALKIQQTNAAILFAQEKYRRAYESYQALDARYFTPAHKKWYDDRVAEAAAKLTNNQYEDAIRQFETYQYVEGVDEMLKDAHYQYAERLSANGQLDRAAEHYQAAGDYKDSAERLQKLRADQLYNNGEYAEAYELYKTLKEDNQSHQADYVQLYNDADALRTNGNYKEAIEAFEAILYMDSETYPVLTKLKDTYLAYAKLLLGSNRVDEAIAFFIKAEVDASEYLKPYYYDQGVKALQANKKTDAKEALIRAEGYSDAADLLKQIESYEQAEAFLYAQDLVSAMKAYQAAGSILDAEAKANECAGILYDRALKTASVTDRVAKLEQLDGYADSQQIIAQIEKQYNDAKIAYASQDYTTALPLLLSLGDYKDAAELAINCKLKQAEALIVSGQYAEALEIYESMDPASLTNNEILNTRLRYADSIRNAGRVYAALAMYREIGESANEQYTAVQLEAVAAITDEETARQQISALSQEDADNPAALYELAIVLDMAGFKDQAVQLYEQLGDYADCDARFQQTVYALAEQAYGRKDYAQVIALLKKIPGYRTQDAQKMMTNSLLTYAFTQMNRAKIAMSFEKYEEAIADYELAIQLFEELGTSYADADKKVAECRAAIEKAQAAMNQSSGGDIQSDGSI